MFLLLCVSQALPAQISIADYLRSAEDDLSLSISRKKAAYLDGSPYALSPLKKIEFRTGNDELKADEQEYALRLNPTNPWEAKNTKRFFEAERSLIGIEEELTFKELLNDRYKLVLDYVHLSELKSLLQRQREFLKKEEVVLLKMSGTSSFDAGDLIDIKLDNIDQLVSITEVEAELDALIWQIKAEHSDQEPIDWAYAHVIGIDGIEKVLLRLSVEASTSSEVSYRESRVNLASSEIELEKAKKNIGFIQGGYDMGKNSGDRIGVSLGIVLPIVNPNKADMAERKLDLIEEEGKLEESKLQVAVDRKQRHEKLKNDILRIRSLDKNIGELSGADYLKTLQLTDGYNPLSTLRVKKGLLKLEVVRLKLLRSLMESYLDYLYEEDALQARPLVNYLDPLLAEM